MTEMINALTVVLDQDVRSEDADGIIEAIKRLSGVLNVQGHVVGVEDHVAYKRVKSQLKNEICELLE